MSLFFGGQGATPSLLGNVTNVIELQAGQTYLLPNQWFQAKVGKNTVVQQLDPIAQFWRTIGAGPVGGSLDRFKGDGNNYRLANQSGCAVGALLTAAGSGYISPPTVTASAGGSIWRAILGGAVNTVVTVSNGGQNYTYPPAVLFAVPPPGGVQATGFCTLTGGAVTSVTITDQGAGYSAPPTITFQNDAREGQNNVPTGFGAAAVATLTGAGTVTAVLCLDHGTPQTAVPTLAFAGGGGTGAAATAIMNFALTGYAVTTGGAGYATPLTITGFPVFPSTAPAYINPTIQSNLVRGRNGSITGAVTGGAIVAAGQAIQDPGSYPAVPAISISTNGVVTTAAALTATVGGVNDLSIVLPA
jgi:hypothetical protein